MFVSFPISTLLRTSFHCSLSSPPDWNIATVSGFLFFTSITSVLIWFLYKQNKENTFEGTILYLFWTRFHRNVSVYILKASTNQLPLPWFPYSHSLLLLSFSLDLQVISFCIQLLPGSPALFHFVLLIWNLNLSKSMVSQRWSVSQIQAAGGLWQIIHSVFPHRMFNKNTWIVRFSLNLKDLKTLALHCSKFITD